MHTMLLIWLGGIVTGAIYNSLWIGTIHKTGQISPGKSLLLLILSATIVTLILVLGNYEFLSDPNYFPLPKR